MPCHNLYMQAGARRRAGWALLLGETLRRTFGGDEQQARPAMQGGASRPPA